jgi:hypothetical protein
MRTEIVIPFAFDTAPIEKLLQEQGETEVMRILAEKVDAAVIANLPTKPDGYGYNTKQVPDWRGFLENRFTRWLDKHQQEIIDEAALLMAAKGSRKKAWREVLAEVKADEGKQQE